MRDDSSSEHASNGVGDTPSHRHGPNELRAAEYAPKGIIRDKAKSLIHILGEMSDFKNEKCARPRLVGRAS